MGFFRRLFQRKSIPAWQELEREIGARFVQGSALVPDRVEADRGETTQTLDTYFCPASKQVYTRLRTVVPRTGGLAFQVYRRGLFTELAAVLGMQDIEVGDAAFDHDFVIKGNDEPRIRELFQNERLRALLSTQADGRFTLGGSNRELQFLSARVIRDLTRLKQLFALFDEALERLHQLSLAATPEQSVTPQGRSPAQPPDIHESTSDDDEINPYAAPAADESLASPYISRHVWRGRNVTVEGAVLASRLWLISGYTITVDGEEFKTAQLVAAENFRWQFSHHGRQVTGHFQTRGINNGIVRKYELTLDGEPLGTFRVRLRSWWVPYLIAGTCLIVGLAAAVSMPE